VTTDSDVTTDEDVAADRRPLGLLLLTIVASAAYSLFVVAQRFWLDDSFITFRYFRNLFEGTGLVFNAGEQVEGYTNFLWGVVGWIGMNLEVEPIFFTQWVSVAAQAVTLWVVYRIGLAASHNRWRALLAPALLAGQIAFLTYPMTGMETTFFTMLVALAFHLFQIGEARTRLGSWGLGLVLVALSSTRFDGFVLIGIMAFFPLILSAERRPHWRGLVLPLVIFLAGFAAYNAWRLSYYSTPLPNSFYAKISFSPGRALDGADYVFEFFAFRQLALVLALLPFALRRTTAVGRFLGWVVLAQTGYVVLVGGDWMPNHRFLFHVLPLFMLLAQEGAWAVWDSVVSRAAVVRAAGAVLLLALLAVNLMPLVRGRALDELTGDHFQPQTARLIGRALDRMLPPEMLVAIEWGGILPYYTHHNVLDTFGITDLEIAMHPTLPHTLWGRRLGEAYLSQRAPDVIVICCAIFPTEIEAWEAVRPGGKSRYGYYMNMNNERFGYTLKVVQLSKGIYWPTLVRRGKWLAADVPPNAERKRGG
jgi:arabinofuranosyltransferase